MQIEIIVDSSELMDHDYKEIKAGVYMAPGRMVVLDEQDKGVLILSGRF